MLNVTGVSDSVFLNSDSITMQPVVSAEWNQNLFNAPYITVAGTGTKINGSLTSGTVSNVTSGAKPNFTTKSFEMSGGKGSVSYTATSLTGSAYKVITYVKTNNPVPVMLTTSGKGLGKYQYGSQQSEVSSLGWTKIVTYVNFSGVSETNSSLVFTIRANALSGTGINPTVLFTLPEFYQTTYFDYQNHSLWSSDSPFTFFRPGESYVPSGDEKATFPSSYRKITSSVLDGYTTPTYSPLSSIIQNPTFYPASAPVPVLKNILPTDISPYKYFVSDVSSRSITAIYEEPIRTNKIVIKLNTLMTIPVINVAINGTTISVGGSANISPEANTDGYNTGLITLYWTGSAWSTARWSDTPKFDPATGALSKSTTISKITVTQTSATPVTQFSSITNDDLDRMQLIEVSPRLEIDLTNLVQDVSINKSLDSQNNTVPISSINSNDARITLSGIPALNSGVLVPIFSSQSDQSSTILANMLRKNIKFYINFNLINYVDLGTEPQFPAKYIPGGVFYSDSWDENDIDTVTVQCYDVSRYLQSLPVPDYVANLKNVFEVITNILDMAGFTDYDFDSLYEICNSTADPLDVAYYYSNSQDTTLIDALNSIFVAYQVGAHIDEYGVMQFLSLYNILSKQYLDVVIAESNIVENTLQVSNKAKPGKISVRYQAPKVKQSPSLQNITDYNNSPSFVYTTSNDVVWQQQTIDSVGFNYINTGMAEDSNVLNINNNDLLDIFHTYNLDNSGYAAIENEIVSFVYKEYTIAKLGGTPSTTVSVKNNLELQGEINKFIKKYSAGLVPSYAAITNVSGNGTTITYTANNTFLAGQKVSIIGVNPSSYNINGTIASATSTQFTISSPVVATYVSGGSAIIFAENDVVVTPTGNITNVQRGMFGTSPAAHLRIVDNLASKALSEGTITDAFVMAPGSGNTTIINDHDSDSSLPSIDKILLSVDEPTKTTVYPTSVVNTGYQTFSVKFELPDQDSTAAGIFFNMASTTSSAGGFFVELIRFNRIDPESLLPYFPRRYKYLMVIYNSSGEVYAWSEVTGECQSIVNNFSKIMKKTEVDGKIEYSYVTDNAFNLKVVYYTSDGSDGENATVADPRTVVSVFLNNVEISGWLLPSTPYDPITNPDGFGWETTAVNPLTGLRQKPTIPDTIETGTRFGFYGSTVPTTIPDLNPAITYPDPDSTSPAILREIHATEKPLIERSVSYFYQDREFLNGIVQDQPLSSLSSTYIMQTTPEIAGINSYDVQYTTPAAVSVDILPIEYLLLYFPGDSQDDQNHGLLKLIDEYSLAYSTVINTGFRAKMVIANNSPNMVFLKKDSDELAQASINFNLWTPSVIAPSDPEIIERVVDQSNLSEVAQIDSQWIQSKEAAYRMLDLVSMGLEGFSKSISIQIFGNPLIQVGDVVNLSYNLNGISQQNYIVQSVSQEFNEGLSTSLVLNRLYQTIVPQPEPGYSFEVTVSPSIDEAAYMLSYTEDGVNPTDTIVVSTGPTPSTGTLEKGLYTYDLYVIVEPTTTPPLQSNYTVTVTGGTLSAFFPESQSMGSGNPSGWFDAGRGAYAFTATGGPMEISIL